MAYEKLGLQSGDLLDTSVFDHIEQALYELSSDGAWLDITKYYPATNVTAQAYGTVTPSDTGGTFLRTANTSGKIGGFVLSVGTYADIKERELIINILENTSYLPNYQILITTGSTFNTSYSVYTVYNDTPTKNTLTKKVNMKYITLDVEDDQELYLMFYFADSDTTHQISFDFSVTYTVSEWVEGASSGNGAMVETNVYQSLSTTTVKTGCSMSETDNGIAIISTADRSLKQYGCHFTIGYYGEIKDKTLYFSIDDDTRDTLYTWLQVTANTSFNINNPLATICQNTSGSNHAVYSFDFAANPIESLTDSDLVRIQFYSTGDVTVSNATEITVYEKVSEWVEGATDLSNYYTKEEVDALVESKKSAGYGDYTLYTIGDSLFAGNTWQNEVVERLGINFDGDINTNPSYPTSIGGTTSLMTSPSSTYFRTMNLINQWAVPDDGEKAIILLENANDGDFTFDTSAMAYKMDSTIELDEITTDSLDAVDDSLKVLNTVIKLKKYSSGKLLTIDTLPTVEGDVQLYVGWSGPGRSTYNIHVVPQDTDEETLQYIYDRIVEYSYKGIYDNYYSDTDSGVTGVSFTAGNSYEVTCTFTDTGSTGMTCSVVDIDSVQYEEYWWFNSLDISQWSDTTLWVQPSYSSGWKSSIEALQAALPKAKIAVVNYPTISKTQSDYLLANGMYDVIQFNEDMSDSKTKRTARNQDICDFYSLKLLDVWSEWGVSITNLTTFYPETANVHPSSVGQKRIGEIIAGMIQGWIR